MKKFAVLAAIATVSAIAAPACAADLVRISLANKSASQIDAEITAAAVAVCGNRSGVSRVCVDAAASDARRQLSGILKARTPKSARAEALTVVRVSLKGKSTDQINAEIKVAAETVCKAADRNATRADLRACVGGAVRSAKAQLQAMTTSAKQQA
uniref:UrcA family protein n=1 Tax=Caulobacter sp. (strain K31) TaxID=366602 RepID=B0T1Q4_CAUSK